MSTEKEVIAMRFHSDLTEEEKSGVRTPDEWAALLDTTIYDPDGWREHGAPPIDQPINYAEFWPRYCVSSIGPRRPLS